jgi:hypothetical protein
MDFNRGTDIFMNNNLAPGEIQTFSIDLSNPGAGARVIGGGYIPGLSDSSSEEDDDDDEDDDEDDDGDDDEDDDDDNDEEDSDDDDEDFRGLKTIRDMQSAGRRP